MQDDRAFQEMLDEFRALGGTADNIRLGTGALGRGLFPIDPARPISIHVPENLLIDTADANFDNGLFRLGPNSSAAARERAFLEAYENRFSWVGGREQIERIFGEAQLLPPELRHELLTEHRCGGWFAEPTPERIQKQFVASRCITYKDRTVLMPIIELVNHGAGLSYASADGFRLSGAVGAEVLVRYSDIDSYGMFLTWGFACDQPQAMSIALRGNVGPSRLHIDREFRDLKPGERVWIPRLAKVADGVELDFLVIGNRQYPRLCRGIFYKVTREAGLTGIEEAFDVIQHVNRTHFLALIATLEDAEGPMVRTLRLMARLQLQTMSYSFGVRAV